jgi:exodeoxyribonuclease VII large subunit
MVTLTQRRLAASRQYLNTLAASPSLQSPDQYIDQRRKSLALAATNLQAAQIRTISLRKQAYVSLAAKLDAMSPLKVLSRGYAMVQTPDGTLIRSVSQVYDNDTIHITLNDGTVRANIISPEEVSG